jgi:hypothetical protein
MAKTEKIFETNGTAANTGPDLNVACSGCIKKKYGACGGIAAENPLSITLEAGQTVKANAPGTSIFRQALAALLPPALGFTGGFFLTRFLIPEAGEAACAATGVIFLFASAFIVYSAKKRKL